jgi:hypothetical protein
VAQLVQRPSGAHAKQFGGSSVRQPGPPAGRVQVEAGDGAGRPAVAQEDWSAGPAGQQAGEELGRPGLPEHPLDRATLAVHPGRRLARSRSSTSKASSSLARAAVSYSSRHRVRSRSGRSRRANSRSSWPRVRPLVRSTWSRRPSRPLVGSAASHPRQRHQPTAARRVASSRFQVAGAVAA